MRQFLFLVFLLVCGIFFLNQFGPPDAKVTEVKPNEVDSTHLVFPEIADRVAEIQKCAKCHQQVYESWLAGPHANAYKNLIKHSEHVAASVNFSADYKSFIDKRMDAVCIACHTGKNLYETNYLGLESENNPKKYNKEHFPKSYKQIQERDKKNVNNLSTGVDCMTCHSYGKKNITNLSSSATGVKGSCELIKSKFFESNQNCFSCHHHQVETMQRLVKEKKLKSEENCVGCHQQFDENGNATHYFYWREESKDIVRPKRLNIFQSVDVKLISKGAEKYIQVEWPNNFLPHDFSECGELVLNIEVLNPHGKSIGSGQIRVNRKNKMQSLPSNHFREGQAGNEFIFGGKIASTQIKVNPKLTPYTVKIVGLVKPQYWSLDEELVEIYQSKLKLKQDDSH
jgi:hypothetical protein